MNLEWAHDLPIALCWSCRCRGLLLSCKTQFGARSQSPFTSTVIDQEVLHVPWLTRTKFTFSTFRHFQGSRQAGRRAPPGRLSPLASSGWIVKVATKGCQESRLSKVPRWGNLGTLTHLNQPPRKVCGKWGVRPWLSSTAGKAEEAAFIRQAGLPLRRLTFCSLHCHLATWPDQRIFTPWWTS